MKIYLHALSEEELEARARAYVQRVTMRESPLQTLVLALCDRLADSGTGDAAQMRRPQRIMELPDKGKRP